MGNIFCGEQTEAAKASALDARDLPSADGTQGGTSNLHHNNNNNNNNSSSSNNNSHNIHIHHPHGWPQQQPPPLDAAEAAARQEEARRQLILQQAGRAMVSVRSTRGSTAYYDQGFAAALHQHLEQQKRATPGSPSTHPLPPASTTPVEVTLSQPAWHNLQLDTRGGLAGLAGDDPHRYLDQQAEAFLDRVRPQKERLFAGTSPMVESLL